MNRFLEVIQQTDNPFLNLFKMNAVDKRGRVFSYFFASRNRKEELTCRRKNVSPQGMAVFAVKEDDPGQLLMIRQYRYPIGDYIYELPAGLIDRHETPQEAAIREVKEETGLTLELYRGGDSCFRKPYFLAQGLTDESNVMVYGTVHGVFTQKEQEDSEDITAFYVNRQQAYEILQNEKISMRAALLLMLFLQQNDPKDENEFSFLNKNID